MKLRKLKREKQKGSGKKISPTGLATIEKEFARAGELMRAGQVEQAENCCRTIIGIDPDHAPALHMIGVIALQQGMHEKAVHHIRKAIRYNPGNAGYLNNLGLALSDLEKYDEAIAAFENGIRLDPACSSLYVNKGLALKAQGKLEEAVTCYQAALKLNPNDSEIHINQGNALSVLDKDDEAMSCYHKALELTPNDGGLACFHQGNLLKKQGRLGEALDCYHRSLEMSRTSVPGVSCLAELLKFIGNICFDQGRMNEAIEKYREALAINPGQPDAYVNLVSALERTNRTEEAVEEMREAAHEASGFHAAFYQAKIAFRRGKYQEALDILEKYESDSLAATEFITHYFLLGGIKHKLKKYCEAFRHYEKANQFVRNKINERINEKYIQEDQFVSSNQLRGWFTKQGLTSWDMYENTDGLPDPVFLLGFARSGTTLLDQILKSHSRIVTLEEKFTLADIGKDFFHDSSRSAFDQLTHTGIEAYRKKYWDRVQGFLNRQLNGRMLIDRNPFYTKYLGHIHRFFPSARIVFAMRDPRDVCLSCFMQDFAINAATRHFTSLLETAEYYATIMNLFFYFQKELPLNIYFVKYESLIEDVEIVTRELLAFLGLDWEEDVLEYNKTARQSYIKTVSYHQVVKPIYKTAVQRWKKYEEEMQPVLPILQPFVEAFGYE